MDATRNTSGAQPTCECNTGYSGDGTVCTDVDECADSQLNDCDANASCNNAPGSFSCSCNKGYTGDGKSCVDIDECSDAQLNTCAASASCTNTPGCFSCSCNQGYTGDGIVCDPIAPTQISAGGHFTCARLNNGKIRCFGYNGIGNLGRGDSENIGDTETPKSAGDVPLPDVGYKSVAVGWNQACAISNAGALRCWGLNNNGRLGYGNTQSIGNTAPVNNLPPVDVGGAVSAVALGQEHICALLSSRKVRCWGNSFYGQGGRGDQTTYGDNEPASAAPLVNLGADVLRISAGKDFTCAVLMGGDVRCWGRGSNGKLGLGNTQTIGDNEAPLSVPKVNLGFAAAEISAGEHHVCALSLNGHVRCWGLGQWGLLGTGNTNTIGNNEAPSSSPIVNLGGQVKAIQAGTYHTCAILTTDKVHCWGLGTHGQLGLASTTNIGDTEDPIAAVNLGGQAAALALGTFHTCTLLENRDMRCFGRNLFGELGQGNTDKIGDDEAPASAPVVPLL